MTENAIFAVLEKIEKICKKTNVKIVLIEGIAFNVWGNPRTTYDIDGILSLQEDETEIFFSLLKAEGFEYEKEIKNIAGFPFITIIYPDFKIPIDLIIAKHDYQKQILNRSIAIKFDKIELSVVSCEDLILLKLISGRSKDIDDVRKMLEENLDKIDFKYLNEWAAKLHVDVFLNDELKSLCNVSVTNI